MPSKISLSQFLTKDVGDWFCKRPVIFVYRSLPRKETVLDFILDEIFREIVKFLGKDRSWRRIRTEYRNFVSGPNITRRVFLSRHLFFFTFNNCSVITSHSLSLSLSLSLLLFPTLYSTVSLRYCSAHRACGSLKLASLKLEKGHARISLVSPPLS